MPDLTNQKSRRDGGPAVFFAYELRHSDGRKFFDDSAIKVNFNHQGYHYDEASSKKIKSISCKSMKPYIN